METNLLSTAMSSLVNQTSAYVTGGVVPHRMGNAHLSLFPYEPLATSDGDLIVVAGNDGQYRKLVTELGAPELAEDPEVRERRQPQRQPRGAAAAAAGDPGDQVSRGVVHPAQRRRHPVRAHQ